MNGQEVLSNSPAAAAGGLPGKNGIPSMDRSNDNPGNARLLQATMWLYLSDIVDEGYDTVLMRLREEGLTAVSLACAYHAGRFLFPHNPKRKLMFLEDGTVNFVPRPAFYGRIKPRVNSLVKEGHGLKELKKHADKLGMETRAWVVCCHNTPLGMKYPYMASRNVFGDRVYHNLCPSNRDVQSYIGGLVQDIASQGVSTIELEALQFQGFVHGFHHEREGIPLSPAARFLLGLCFCDACLRKAGKAHIDIGKVRRFTKETLEMYFADPESVSGRFATVESLPQEVFDPFRKWRTTVISSFVEHLVRAVRGSHCKLRPMISLQPASQQTAGMDAAGVAESTGGVLALGYVKDGDALRPLLARLQSELEGKEIILGVQVGLPESGGKREFLDRMRAARGLGITGFNFYNYGLIPLEYLRWIREALH